MFYRFREALARFMYGRYGSDQLNRFLIVIFFSKIIALASIVSAAAVTAYVWWQPEILSVRLVLLVFALLILVRHRPNLERMLRHEENKVKWVPDLGGRAGKREKEE